MGKRPAGIWKVALPITVEIREWISGSVTAKQD